MSNLSTVVEPHARNLETSADAMEGAGIGGHPTRGHAAIMRRMAADLRANAVQGKLPSAFDAGMYASAASDTAPAPRALTALSPLAAAAANPMLKPLLRNLKRAASDWDTISRITRSSIPLNSIERSPENLWANGWP